MTSLSPPLAKNDLRATSRRTLTRRHFLVGRFLCGLKRRYWPSARCDSHQPCVQPESKAACRFALPEHFSGLQCDGSMQESPKRDRRLRSSLRPGKSLHLLDCERPQALVEGRIVLRLV